MQADGTTAVPLTGQCALLLRLLLLWEEGPVSIDLAAHVLRVKSNGMGTYVGLLRDVLGDRTEKSIVRTLDGDPRSSPRRPTTYETSLRADSHDFLALADEALGVAGIDWCDHRDLSPDAVAAATPLLDQALALWRGSPAVGFDEAGHRPVDRLKVKDPEVVDGQREVLLELFDIWQRRHADAVLLRADCTLASDQGKRASVEVLNRVSQLLKQPLPDDRIWYRLLLAAQRADDRKRQRDFYERAIRHFQLDDEEVPPEVEELRPKSVGKRASVQVAKARRGPTVALSTQSITPGSRLGGDELERIIEAFGIASPASLELGEVGLSPIECTKRADNGLDFAGVLGGKWVSSREAHDSFVAMLQRFQTRKPAGRARFLVIDPRSDAYERLVQIRGGAVSPKSVQELLALQKKFPCLEVRLTTHLPAFRVLVIDDDIVSVSPYDLENQSEEASRLDFKAPHMLLDPLAPFPLAPAFRLYFEGEWNGARRDRSRDGNA